MPFPHRKRVSWYIWKLLHLSGFLFLTGSFPEASPFFYLFSFWPLSPFFYLIIFILPTLTPHHQEGIIIQNTTVSSFCKLTYIATAAQLFSTELSIDLSYSWYSIIGRRRRKGTSTWGWITTSYCRLISLQTMTT